MRHALPVFSAALAVLFASAPAAAQELLAVNFQGNAFGVDVATGQARSIGPTGASACNAMALHNGVLYSTSRTTLFGPQKLVSIDPITAQATVLFPNLGVDLRGLCGREGTNELFGIADGVPDRLVRIDLATGQVTNVGNTGLTGIQALDTGASVGFLFGWDINIGLVRIDPNTGAAVDVNLNVGTQGAAIQFLTTVVTNNDTLLLGGNTSLYGIDRLTGVVTAIGGTTNLADLRGAEQHRGRATVFGTGCQTALGAQASIDVKSQFLPGTTVAFGSPQHQPNCVGVLLVGLSNTNYQGIPLPFAADPVLGTSGCQLLVSADGQLPAQANGSGLLVRPFTLLAIPGFVLHFQFVALEPVPGGFSFSSGLTVQTPF